PPVSRPQPPHNHHTPDHNHHTPDHNHHTPDHNHHTPDHNHIHHLGLASESSIVPRLVVMESHCASSSIFYCEVHHYFMRPLAWVAFCG
ncbi:hypothetical protein FHG87_010820, partial [Trinorchestia longiramus]